MHAELLPGAGFQVPPVLTKSGYAAYRQVSPSMVSKLIRQQKLAAPALRDDGQIVVALADDMLGRNLDPTRVRRPLMAVAEPSPAPEASAERAPTPRIGEDSFAAAKTRRERANAELAEINLLQARKELIPLKAAIEAMKEQGTQTRQQSFELLDQLSELAVGVGSKAEARARFEPKIIRFLTTLAEIATREMGRVRAA